MKQAIFIILAILLAISSAYAAEDVCLPEEETCTVTYEESTDVSKVIEETEEAHEDSICVLYFYSTTCSKCAQLKPYLEELEEKYGDKIHINKLEVSHNLENYQAYNEFCGVQSIPFEDRGIPLIAVGEKSFMGLNTIKDNLEDEIKILLESDERICPLPDTLSCSVDGIKKDPDGTQRFEERKITLALIIAAGLIDGINPCAFAVLIFLITFLIEISSTKRRMIKAGTAYIVSVYVTYFIAGIGLLTAIQMTGLSSIIMKVAATVAILAGLINVKDYFWYGKGITLAIPKKAKPLIERWTRKANIPGAIILGFLVSMFELPCTGGVYLAILAMLSSTAKATAALYLLLYNFMFVLPLIVILILVTYGMKAEHLESWRKSKKNWMKLGMGLLLLILGIGMLLGWF